MKQFDDLDLVEEYKKCNRCRIVAEKFGCSVETVRRALIKYDVPRIQRNPRPVTRKPATEEELKTIAAEYHNNDVTISFLAAKYKRAPYTVSDAIKKYGHGLKIRPVNCLKVTDAQLIEACKTMTRKEVAEHFGIHIANLDKRMRKLGIHAVKEKVNGKKRFDSWHYIKSQAVLFEDLQPSFEYLGYFNDRIKMRCKTCGAVVERATSTARYKNISCENCRQAKQLRVDLINVLTSAIELKTPKTCKCCGMVFYSKHPDVVYCSEKCRRKSKRSSYKNRCKKYGVFYDNTVTRKAVIKRDGNICQICGKVCNENDKRWGNIGPDFPTIDHIIPLALGGEHTWENVQCACAICNSYKRDLIEYEEEQNADDVKCG